MSEVDYFTALGLQDPTHNVDGSVVAVKQAGGRYETDGVSWSALDGHRGSPRSEADIGSAKSLEYKL
jgi:hypothetical protein